MSIMQRITEFFTTATNALSQRLRAATLRWRSVWRGPTYDWGRADYQFWRDAYYGRVRGLEIAGVFLKPIVGKISAWALGRRPQWRLDNETAEELLNSWWADNHSRVLQAYAAALRQGDSAIVVNPDLSLTIVPPDAIDPIVDPADFSRVLGWRVTQTYPHPELAGGKQTVIDEYYPDRRVQRRELQGRLDSVEEWPNLLGRVPFVLIANQADENGLFGHAEAEGLVEVLQRYGDLLEAALEGNKFQGRPTPVLSFGDVRDMEKFWELYGVRERQTLPDGRTEEVITLGVDLTQILTVSNATFEYKSPGNFAGDTERLAALLFYLILEHTEIPEFVFGNAIASSQASAETQMPVFVRFIEGRQGEIARWLVELAEIVLGYIALTTPGATTTEAPALQWESLSSQDGRLTFDTVAWAYTSGLIDERTALVLAPVDVEDIDAVLEAARAEREERGLLGFRGPDGQDMDQSLQDEINQLELGD